MSWNTRRQLRNPVRPESNGRFIAATAVAFMGFAVACGDGDDGRSSAQTPTATVPAVSTQTATVSPLPTAMSTATASATRTETPKRTETPTPTATSTPTPTATATPTSTTTPVLVSLTGDAIPFIGSPDGRIEGAEVFILERPELRVTTGADGHFEFHDLEVGSEATLVMDHPDYYPIQTATILLGPEGAERVTFQAVTFPIFDAFAALLGVEPDPTRCQMVTTVTRVGRSIYDPGAHGEAGATVTLEPPLPEDQGPIYFNASVLPDRGLSETSEDGGVLFLQVPPGEYVWTASKPGVEFSQVKMKCRPGILVNASPPWGLQAQAGDA